MKWSVILLAVFFTAAGAQQPSTGAGTGRNTLEAQSGPMTIHVDEKCRIFPTPGDMALRKKAHPYRDSVVCNIESAAESSHWEESILGNHRQRTFVRVQEHEFVLQDIADEPVMFVVSQKIPKNWAIDSDPQPVDLVGRTAYFHVYVKSGETVRLHVGMRRDWPQKPI